MYALWLWLCATPLALAIVANWHEQGRWHSRHRAIHALFLASRL